MKIQDHYSGYHSLFQGERTVWLKSIPVGANIVSARIVVTPKRDDSSSGISEDEISFGSDGIGTIADQPEQLATKTRASSSNSFDWVEVDFHGRRTLVGIEGTGATGASLQVDVGGGSFIDINMDGAFKGPEDTPFTVQHESLPGLTVNRVKLTSPDTANIIDISQITIRNIPSNVSLALGGLPAFWMHIGEMVSPQSIPDFKALLQSVLLDAEVENGFYIIPVVMHSDSLARLDLDFDIQYMQQLKVLPEGINEARLPYDYHGLPQSAVGLLTVSLPANARVLPKQTQARIIGSFNGERILQGPIGNVPTDISALITPDMAQAHLINIGEDITGSAFDFLLQPMDELVRLQLDVREDLDGKPSSASLLSEPVNFSLDRKVTPEASWHHVSLPEGFRFEDLVETKRLWLLIQSLAGQSRWITHTATGTDVRMQHSKNGGLSWRATLLNGEKMQAQYRLRYEPAQYTVPVHLQVGEGELARNVSLDRFQALGRVDFDLDFEEVATTINQYLDDKVGKVCPEREHLENGDFSRFSETPPINEGGSEGHETPQVIWIPLDWKGSGESISESFSSGVSLGSLNLNQATALSQIVPISSGCTYQLEIIASAYLEGAVVEIIWQGSACNLVKVDRLAIPVLIPATGWYRDGETTTVNSGLPPKRARFIAPDDANQAEIRIKIPEYNNADIEWISFRVTDEVLGNTDLKDYALEVAFETETESYAHTISDMEDWDVIGNINLLAPGQNAGFINNSSTNSSFIQSVPVIANKPYSFIFDGSSTSAANPSVSLQWKNGAEESAVPPIEQTITADDLNQYLLQGNVPAGITQLDISITLVPDSNLSVEKVSFRQPEMLDVPLNLISQAPGELVVSDVQIAYEIVEAKALPIPASGLCSATPAESEPGDVCEKSSGCVLAERETAYISTESNPRIGVTVSPTVPEPIPVHTDDLSSINGIGPARKARLAEVGITTFNQLSRVEVDDLLELFQPAISHDQAKDYIRKALEIVHSDADNV